MIVGVTTGGQADLDYLARQMGIKRELDQLASVLRQKQELCRVTEANGADLKTFEETKRKSDEEVKRNEEEITKLTSEVCVVVCAFTSKCCCCVAIGRCGCAVLW